MKVYRQGDTIRRGVKLAYKGTGDPVNLTGCTAYSQMRRIPGDELVLEGIPSIDIAQGTVRVEFTAEQTSLIEPGTYGFDIRLKSVWRASRPDIGDYSINPVGQSGTDVITLYTERIQIVEAYTEME